MLPTADVHKVFFIIFSNNLLTLQLLQVEKDLIICLLFLI